jgi:RNA polymerase sigma-70 factor (ECF subfamily)
MPTIVAGDAGAAPSWPRGTLPTRCEDAPDHVPYGTGTEGIFGGRQSVGEDGAASAAMDRCACGDDAAFAELYDLLAPKLFAFLLRQTRDRSRAEDLVQQTLLQMHCARDTYVTGADVLPWMFAIARRLAIDSYRRGKREVLDGEMDSSATSLEMAPDDALRSKQAARVIQETLDALPETQRTAFELIKLDGLSIAQTAEVLGTTVTAVKLRAHRTYEALRAALLDV